MPNALADRNLLFGILALQMDFIRRDALIAAMNAWVLNKSRALGQVLLDHGALSGERHALLEALVREHLRLHDDDPEKSLAAVSAFGSAQQELKQIADADVQASLAQVSAYRQCEPDPYRTNVSSVGAAAASGTRFRILRPHARGGLGEVFVAHDQELHREVALKEIQDRHADRPESRARFLVEAEITGGLEHPGIVPVYGLGQYADGRPYYAMRFIKGDSLKEAIERFHKADQPGRDPGERALKLRDLIGSFIDVCNAIGYAHSRGVLHRDLKPGNIMLGKYGETLVVDWGLAKPIEKRGALRDAEENRLQPPSLSRSGDTLAGTAVGTPGFMSPEQATGRLDLLGPASDVYSLGATLYCLLTGQPPFIGADAGSILRKVQQGDFAPPRQLKRDLPAALEAICIKAMMRRPEDRYAATRTLAEDLEHWLADEPVGAYPEPPAVRLGRWGRRHKPLVACALALVIALVPTLSLATIVVGRERRRAEDNFQAAEKHRQQAEKNFQLAHQAVDRFYTEVSESQLLNQRGAQPLRQRLLETVRDFYRQFITDHGDDPGVQADLGKALARLAFLTDEIESKSRAIQLYREALAILEPLGRAHPGVRDYQSCLASSYLNVASLYRYTGRPDLADDALRKAVDRYEVLARDGATLADQRALARAYHERGYRYYDIGQRAEAIAFLQKALTLRERLAAAHPDDGDVQSDLAMSYNRFGRLHQEQGDPDKALAAHQKACAIRERLVRDCPLISQYESDLSWSHHHVGRALAQLGHISEALHHLGEGRRSRERLVDENPTVMELRCDLAFSYHDIALLLDRGGQTAEACALLERAHMLREQLVAAQPIVTDYQSDLAWSHYHIGCIAHRACQEDAALASLARAIAILEPLVSGTNNPSLIQAKLAASRTALGRVYRAVGRLSEARRTLEQAREIQEQLVHSDPAVADWQNDLAETFGELGALHRALRQPNAARHDVEQERALREELVHRHPSRVDFAGDLDELERHPE